MLANKLMSALSGGAEDKLYVDDVFSTYLYTGNSSTQTINNGIDLVGKGGMVWTKSRSATYSNILIDTAGTGTSKFLKSDSTEPLINNGNALPVFLSTGYSTGNRGDFVGTGELLVNYRLES
jgi:hypothetical protein